MATFVVLQGTPALHLKARLCNELYKNSNTRPFQYWMDTIENFFTPMDTTGNRQYSQMEGNDPRFAFEMLKGITGQADQHMIIIKPFVDDNNKYYQGMVIKIFTNNITAACYESGDYLILAKTPFEEATQHVPALLSIIQTRCTKQ